MAKKTTKTEMMNFDDMLNSASQISASSPKKQSSNPIVKLDAEQSKLISTFNTEKKNMKDAETAMKSAGQEIQKIVQQEYDNNGFCGQYSGTYQVVSEDGKEKISCIYIDKWSIPQKPEEVAAAKEAIGEDVWNKVTIAKREVVLKPEVFTDDKLKKEFMELMASNFGKFFNVEIKYETIPDLKEKIYDVVEESVSAAIKVNPGNKDLILKEKLDIVRSVLVQQKPSLK